MNLFSNAGETCGIGDGRTEKGKLNFGCWEIVESTDKRWRGIADKYGRKAQIAAMEHPEAADSDTEELFAWYQQEIVRREVDRRGKSTPTAVVASHANGRGQRGNRVARQ